MNPQWYVRTEPADDHWVQRALEEATGEGWALVSMTPTFYMRQDDYDSKHKWYEPQVMLTFKK